MNNLTRKASALLIAVSTAFAATCAQASYYGDNREYPQITAEDLVYTKYDITKIEKLGDEFSALLKTDGNLEAVKEKLGEMNDEAYTAESEYTLSTIESSRNYNETTAAQANDAYDTAAAASKILNEAIKQLYNSDYKYALTEAYGEDGAKELIDSLPDDEYYTLMEEENSLISEYDKNFGTDTDKCAEIFVELVGVRNKMAQAAGYDNYAEYAYDATYHRDFTTEDAQKLCTAVYEYAQPLMKELTTGITALYMTAYIDGGSLMYGGKTTDEAGALDTVYDVVNDISPELGRSFEYMRSNNLFDAAFSETKSDSAGSYTVFIDALEVPYIFINPSQDYSDDATENITTLIHEFGHFSSLLNEPIEANEWYDEYSPQSMDFAEIHSQGLEALAHKYYGKMFGAGSQLLNYVLTYNLVSTILDGCVFNEWQRRVYEADNLTVSMCDTILFDELSQYNPSSEVSKDTLRYAWTSMYHNFSAPMYYISYAVSGLAALEILEESMDDYDAAVDMYMKASAVGSYVEFRKALKNVGIPDIFDTDNIKNTFESLTAEMVPDYDDVSIDDLKWYLPYIYGTANIFRPRSEKNFEPESNITRGEFAELIYNWYGFYDVAEKVEYTESDEDNAAEKWCVASGIMEGYDKDNFGENDPLTREMVATVFKRLAQCEDYESETAEYEMPEDYSDCSDWAADGVEWSVANGLMNGDENGLLLPQDECTRAEAAKMVSEFTAVVR